MNLYNHRNKFIYFFLTLIVCSNLLADISCLGPKSATKFWVYLHGMDSPVMSSQEMNNRETLLKIANKLNIRFALPRAVNPCPTNDKLICWTWAPRKIEDIKPVQNSIEQAADKCFSKKEYGVLGFSNGGVAAQAIIRLCMKNKFTVIIAIGAVGMYYPGDLQDLSNCSPRLISMIGSDDNANKESVTNFVKHLKSIKANVELVQYFGGHSLPRTDLENILK